MGGQIVRMGVLIGALALGTGLYHYWTGHEDWQTMMFTTLAFAQVWQALGVRSNTESIFRLGFFSNPIGLLLAVGVIALQLAAIYVPFLQQFLGTTTLAWNDLALCFGVGVTVLILTEIEKWWVRKSARVYSTVQRGSVTVKRLPPPGTLSTVSVLPQPRIHFYLCGL